MRKFLIRDPLLDRLIWLPIRGATGGGSGPPPPSPAQDAATTAQTDIMRQQLAIAQQQQQYSNAITPLMLSQGGYDIAPQEMTGATSTPASGGPQYITGPSTTETTSGPHGGMVRTIPGQQTLNPNYKAATSTPGTPAALQPGQFLIPIGGKNYVVNQKPGIADLQNLNMQVATAADKRALAAASGTLPVDPGVEQDLTRGRTQLQEELLKRLGPGYETSDPGIRAMNEFDRQANSLRFQVRYGELSNAGALASNAQGALQSGQNQQMGTLTAGQQPFAVTSQMLGGAAGTAGNIVQQQQNQNFGAFNLGLQQSQIGAGILGSGMSALGSVGVGAAIL